MRSPTTNNQKPTTTSTPCRHMVSDLFHRPSGLLFTFPSRYLFTIGLEKYLDLPVSSGGFPRAFRVPGYLRTETKKIFCFRLWDYHPLGSSFPAHQSNKKFDNFSDINITSLPRNTLHLTVQGLVFSAFARRYWRNACLFIFLQVLKCFTSLRTLLLRFLSSWLMYVHLITLDKMTNKQKDCYAFYR